MEERSIRPQLCRATLFSCSTTMIRSYDYEVAKDALPYQGIWTYFEWYTLRSVLLWKQFNCWRPFRLMEYNQTPRISNSCCCSWCSCSSQKPSHGNISVTKRGIHHRSAAVKKTGKKIVNKKIKKKICQKWSNMVKMVQNGPKGWKRVKMVKNGKKWSKRSQMVQLEVGARRAPRLLVVKKIQQ